MKNVKLKVISAIIAASTIFGVVTPVYASPITEQAIQEVQSKQDEYKAIEKRITELHMEMDEILDDITYIVSLIDENNAKIAEVEANKALKLEEIRSTEAELAQKNLEYGERLRAMYKQGNTGIIDAMLGSESLADFISRADAVIKIAKIDKQILDEIEAIRTTLETQKSELQASIDELLLLNQKNEENLAQVEVKKAESDAKMAEEKIEKEKIMNDLALKEAALIGGNEAIINSDSSSDAELNDAITALRAAREHVITDTADASMVELIEKAKDVLTKREAARVAEAARIAAAEAAAKAAAIKNPSSTNSNTASRPAASSASGQAIADYAHNFLGIPYVWGGNTVSGGLDCSGLTRLVYGEFGINLPRVSRDQATRGTYVPISQAQPGDLLYFGQSRVTHVGIYIGNGKMIHAPQPGDNVKISSISWHVNNYSIQGARRFSN